MPPATNTPPVARTISPRLPATAPSTEQKSASAISQTGSVPASARCGDRGGGIVAGPRASTAAVSGRIRPRQAGSSERNVNTSTRPLPDSTRSHETRPYLLGQELDQAVLQRRARRQVDVAPLRGDDLVAVLGRRPEQERLAEAGAGAQHGDRAVRRRAGPPPSATSSSAPTAVTPSAAAREVVDQHDARDPEPLRQRAPVDDPGQVGGAADVVLDRARRCRGRRVVDLGARAESRRAAATRNCSAMTSSDGVAPPRGRSARRSASAPRPPDAGTS